MDEGAERRRKPRVAIGAKVRCGPTRADVLLTRRLRDISASGMFLVTDTTWEQGTEVDFQIFGEEGEPLAKGLARVVWIHPSSGMGLEFISVDLGREILDLLEAAGEESARPAAAAVRPRASAKRTGADAEVTIGIDLGTSNTCASAVLDGRPQVIPTRYGTNTIPSVVAVDRTGKLLVGHAAAKRMILEPDRTVYGSKRLVGRTFLRELAEEYQPHFAYPIVEAEGGGFGASVGGAVLSMEEVARQILLEVRQVAEAHRRAPVRRAVVSVPAHFAEAQRRAVREAAEAAGLVVARIVPEPTAAAVAYGFRRGVKSRLAVFDLGGGTFDVSVLSVEDDRFEVLACGGDNFLGGVDLDDLVASHLLESFERQTGEPLRPTAQQLARLREAAEEAKRGLSVQARLAVMLPHFADVRGSMRDLAVALDRPQLEEMAAPLLDRALAIADQVLKDCGLEPSAIDEVLMVGGMTRMPLVRARVEAFFGRRVSLRVNPDEAVALGAALLANDDDEGAVVTLVDVLPLSIGVAGEGRRLARVLKRNAAVPATGSHVVRTTRADQGLVEVPVFQGERDDAAANEYLGTAVVRGLPPGPAGSQGCELLMTFDEAGVLSLRARELRTGAEVPVDLDRRGSVAEAVRRLGPYRGPAPDPRRRAESALGRIFASLGRLFRK